MTALAPPIPLLALRAPRSPAAAVYRRRRLVALLVLAAAALLVDLAGRAALAALDGGPLTAVGGTSSAVVRRADPVVLDAEPVAQSSVVVRSGDTLWAIARRIQPTGDVRPLVDQLAEARGGRTLQPGERIELPRP